MNCPLCQQAPLEPRFKLPSYTLARCRRCGVLFNQTYYEDPDFKRGLFEDHYYESVQSEAFKNKLDQFAKDPSLKVFSRYLALIETQAKPGRVLDVGCAFGNFLKLARDRGWDPYGVEISAYASQKAKEAWGFPIFNGDIAGCLFEKNSFDLVTFWDVIEHVEKPQENLKRAHELLKPGGFLLLTTDNGRSLIGDLARFLYHASFGKLNFGIRKFYIPHNTCFFDRDSMRKLLKEYGFAPIYFKGVDYPIEKMNLSGAERALVVVLYFLGALLGRRSQFLVVSRKI